MQTEAQLRDKIRKIKALFERPGSEGERRAAEAALNRIQERLEKASQTAVTTEMKFSLGNAWSRRLFVALCRRYSLRPYRYRRQHHTTVMLRVPKTFVDEALWPEFFELNTVLVEYLNSITDRIIAEEVHGTVGEAEEVNEPPQLTE
jgi:hypothetical protein